jgi:phage replication O-like protein O
VDRDFNIKDGGWFPVMHDIADKLITTDLTKVESRVLWMFFRYCYGYNRATCELQWKDMKDITGLGDGSLSKAINRLKSRNIIKSFQSESKTYVTYKINSKISSWKEQLSKRKDFPNVKQTLHKRKVNTSQTESTPIKDNIKTTLNTTDIFLPDWLDLEVWNEYKKYRQNGKGKFTPYAQKLAINKLAKLKDDGNDPTEVMQRTIECGWSGLYPLKENKNEVEAWIKQVSQD